MVVQSVLTPVQDQRYPYFSIVSHIVYKYIICTPVGSALHSVRSQSPHKLPERTKERGNNPNVEEKSGVDESSGVVEWTNCEEFRHLAKPIHVGLKPAIHSQCVVAPVESENVVEIFRVHPNVIGTMLLYLYKTASKRELID